MKRMFGYVVAAVLLTALQAASSPVLAQSPKIEPPAEPMPTPVIGVIDFQYVVKESAAGKSVRAQIDKRQQQFQAEIRPIQKELEKIRAEFGNRLPVASDRTDGALAAKRKAMRERVNELQRLIQERKRELDDMFNTGMHQVDLALVAVLKELAQERGINLILNAGRGRGLVLFAENQIVITDEALRRLDKRLPKVVLTKAEPDK